MTGFEWAMLIFAALNTGNALTAGTDVETETPAPPAGGPQIDPKDFADLFSQQQGGFGSIADIPTLAGPVEQATQAAARIPKTEVTTPPQIPGPPPGVQIPPPGPAVAKAGTPNPVGPVNPQMPKQAPDIGQLLAAIGPAIEAVAPLLGLNDQRLPESRAAPISGGGGGGLVGRFANRPGGGGIDIGQLLAALPGIRG